MEMPKIIESLTNDELRTFAAVMWLKAKSAHTSARLDRMERDRALEKLERLWATHAPLTDANGADEQPLPTTTLEATE